MSDVYPIEGETCNHPFDSLSTSEDRNLICNYCGFTCSTDSQDAFELLFLSAAIKISTQDDKISNIESFISKNFGNSVCSFCDTWIDKDEPDSGVKLNNIFCCIEHVALGVYSLDEENLIDLVCTWLKSTTILESSNISKKFILEELFSSLPELKKTLLDDNCEINETIIIDPMLVKSLELTVPITVDDAVLAMCKLLALEPKTELFYSKSLFLGIIAGAELWIRGDLEEEIHFEDSFESETDIIYNKIAERSLSSIQLNRIKSYVEILGEDIPDIFTVDGEMVDQLLVMTASRGAEMLLSAFIAQDEI